MISRLFLSLLFVCSYLPQTFAAKLELKLNHPTQYSVVKGDTLWDISEHFLKSPWMWPELWKQNSQIKNPHLIYPGDVLTLHYIDGKPVLELSHREPARYKLSPKTRAITLENAIPLIPLADIRAFLTHPKVLAEAELSTSPYVVSGEDERLISGTGEQIYVRALNTDDTVKRYSIFSQGKVYNDPETQEVLGYEAIYKGIAHLVSAGEPATLELTTTTQEILIGDRLLPLIDDNYETNFIPRAPENTIEGVIISVFNGVSQIGQYQIMVINRGEREGLSAGHMLSILQRGDTIQDSVTRDRGDSVTLPDISAGVGMVFKTFEKVSYVIILRATRAIHLHDKVRSLK